MSNNSNAKNVHISLKKLSIVKNIAEIKIKDKIVKNILVHHLPLGELVIKSISLKDSTELFDFYFQGLSEKARNFFCPYPLFNPLPKDAKELSKKIKDWKKENDWTVLKLLKEEKIIGMCLLKKYKTKNPTSGLAVHEKFRTMGLGILLQTIIDEQAQLLRLKKLTITLAQNNVASLKVHEKAGYKKTGRLVPHTTYINGIKKIDRYDFEMTKIFG